MVSLKNSNITLGLVLLVIIFLSKLNFKVTDYEIPILGFHGILDAKAPVLFSPKESLNYPQHDLEQLLEDLIAQSCTHYDLVHPSLKMHLQVLSFKAEELLLVIHNNSDFLR